MKTRKTIDFIIQNLVLVLVLVWCVCVSVPQSGVMVMQSSASNAEPYERLVAPGPPNHREAYFNGSSYLRLQTAVSLKRHIGLSFKTCSGGELFSQNYKDREIKLSVQNNRLLLTIASSLFRVEIPIDGHFLDNEWHTVNIVYRLANLTLSVDDYVQVVANSTYNNYILTDPDLHSDNAVLIVGKLFTGCLIDGPSLVFDNSLQNPYLPKFGGCLLLPNCSIDYGLISDLTLAEKPSNHCVNEPCLRMGKCISHKADYECICKPQYAGKNCDRDVGPPCTRKIDPVICKNGGICHELEGDFTCMCPGGFEGKYCEQDMSRFCDINLCQNNGTCLKLSSNEYKCICMNGFSGANCELDFNDCASNPCKNNAKCIDGPNTYMCECPIGFEGKNCEYNIDECSKKPCKYNGVCFDTYGSYICQCLSGFYGQNCELNVNECLSNPCLNGGQCNDEVGSYLCHCAEGFTGQRCESRTTCNGIACPLNADCQEIKSGEFQCICKTGFSGIYSMEGLKNCIPIPGCEANTCRNGGTCYEFGDKFNCTCPVGFAGIRCETSEPCKAASLCLNGGTCIDELNNSYKCQCSKEYTGTNCEKRITCKDNPCVYADACDDIMGSYYCECKTGYTGFNCDVDIDECDPNSCLNGATCIQNTGFFDCECAPGFTGKLCQKKIDSCASHPCKNGATCSEQLNGFMCNCPPDYTGTLCEKTQNICDRQRPCQNNATCITMDKNEFKCNCTPGFDGATCSNNIDDCQGKVCPEGQICIDGINSYECQCPPGFAGDNCSINVDFCKSQPCQNNATCIDNGHLYRCQCLQGYTGTQCETDIDECSLPQYSKFCLHGICVNKPGSFSCYCQPGYTGEQCEVNYDECLSNPCKNKGECIDEVNNYTCICSPGYTGRDCTININDCDPNPCVEGSTCIDGINSYTCECQPGLTGQNCEINIDDCQPNPCQNGGLCVDGLNSYDCNCTGTGYTGMLCETNIDDCLSNPCEHGALCIDGVNDYQCACFEGYTGKNCEFDFDDCESSPCKYNGTCLQRSNETLYYSQSDWNSTLPSIFHEEFNYNTSSGYECICVPGTMGHDCEINIDECQSSPCVGGSTCQDKIGEFVCLCENGFEGDRCEHEIDECERYKPCVFGKCTDRIANYDCECNPGYGGKNCSVQLTGCDKNECLNNGTCKPYLVNETIHKFNCSCPNGFHGRVCEKVTTMSFNGNSYVVLNTSREEGYDIQFRFKTTLASGLLAVGKGSTYYFLELTNGRLNLHSSILNKWEGVFIGSKLNDSNWQKVFVAINSSHLVLAANEEQTIYPITINEGSTNHTSFPTTYIGGTISNLRGLTPLTQNLPDFVGCTEDVVVNGEWVIPEDILSTPSSETAALVNISLGCPREEQCTPNPCHSGGHCTDLWQTFKCVCERPYLGRTCQYNFTAATFGHENITNSVVTVNITESARRAIRSIAHISMFIRTRQDKGQIFHLGSAVTSTRSADDIYIAAQLEAGELLVGIQFNGTPEAYTVNGVKLHNGYNHLIEVSRNVTLIQVKLNGTEYFRKTISATGPLDVQFLYLGGIPQPSRPVRQADAITASQQNRAELNTSVPNFKGIIQDVQISNGTRTMVVEFFPLKANDLEIPLSFGKVAFEKNLILQGVVSDDMCRSNPCFNNGTCFNTWNDFECKCPLGYKGKTCQEMEFCQLQHCPYGSTCRSLNNGYECIANITFDSLEPLKYEFINITEETIPDFNTIKINYRSNMGGTIFYAQSDGEYFIVSVYRDTIFVNWKIRDESDVHLFRKDTPDGNWTSLLFIIKDNELKGGFEDNVRDELPNFTSMKSFSAEALSNLLKRSKIVLGEGFNVLDKNKLIDRNYKYLNSTVYDTTNYATTEAIMMGNSVELPMQSALTTEPLIDSKMSENYKGCLGEIRIGEYLLPYYMKTEIYKNMTPTEYFDLITDRSQSKYYKDSCILCFDTDCKNGGQCRNNKQEYVCDCPAGFEADDCRINIDECISNNCTNNSTCIDGIANYTCTCQPGWEGWLCDSQIDECLSNPCFNGGECRDKLAAFECICLDAYTGDRCEALKLITCDNNPCHNGATCIDGKNVTTGNNFTCNCATGYEGSLCDKPFCEVTSCDRGYCNITNGLTPFCACHPGYTGKYCEENIDDCVVSTGGSPCQHGGICIDGIEKFTCNCTGTGYGGLLCEMDNNECVMYPKEETCGWNGTCINIEGSYRCECALGKCGHGCKLDDPCYQAYRDVNASSVTDVCGPYGNCQEMCDITVKYNCICSDGYGGKNCESLMATREADDGGINLAYIIVPIVLILVGALVAGVCVLVGMARNKRATRGTYSPSAQEFCNPRVEMDHVLKPPPEERLI